MLYQKRRVKERKIRYMQIQVLTPTAMNFEIRDILTKIQNCGGINFESSMNMYML